MNVYRLGALLLSDRLGLRIVLLALAAALTAAMAASPALAQEVAQDTEQEGEGGELGQSGKVSQTGDNSNQCVALQPVGNTGNVQNIITIEQYQSYVEEFEFDDVGGSIEIAPEQIVECDQAVNQAATAANEENPGHCSWSWDDGWWCLWSTDHSWWYQDYYGAWTAYNTGLWYADHGGWWWLGYDGWWWTDGYYWWPYGWTVASGYYSAVSDVSAGALNGSGSVATLGVLATLGLAGTGLVIRRNRSDDPEG